MRIAYSCAGEGFGHAARMVALEADLRLHHHLDLFVPAPVKEFVKTKVPDAVTYDLPCFELAKTGNAIDYRKSLFMAYKADIISSLKKLASLLTQRQIDVVLSDFDPFLPWAARLAGVPVVQMNHPGIVIDRVEFDATSILAAILARLMEGPYDKRIIVSFYHGTIGPVLRPTLLKHRLKDDGFLAVNLKGQVRAMALEVLNSIPGLNYRLYPSPGADFDEGLATCSAVLTTAGHQTLSEALCLGKPVLALPQKGQFEQVLNARMLQKTGLGTWCLAEDLDKHLSHFWHHLDQYKTPTLDKGNFCFKDSRQELLAQLEQAFFNLSRQKKLQPAGTKIKKPVFTHSL